MKQARLTSGNWTQNQLTNCCRTSTVTPNRNARRISTEALGIRMYKLEEKPKLAVVKRFVVTRDTLRASAMSKRPKFPGIRESPVEKNP